MNKILSFFQKINPCKKTIFIVEDNEVYAKALKRFIQRRFNNIKEIVVFNTGETCLRDLNRNPKIIIMDYYLNSKNLNAHNGLEIIKRIKELKPSTNIIVLSSQEKFNVVLEAVKQYDCSYVQKDSEAFRKVQQLINLFLI